MLDNSATCHDQQVFNDTEVFLCLRIPGTKDQFEELTAAANGVEFFYDYPARKKEEPKKED